MKLINFIKNLLHFCYYFFGKDAIERAKNKHIWQGYGINIFVGLPGHGKTVSLAEYGMRVHAQYPDVPIYSNFNFEYETAPITKWQDLVDYPTGLFLIDELQLTFSSRDWKDFPVEMLTLLTQNRKQRKQLCCTTQDFGFVDKNFRVLTNLVIECQTLAGRWTFQKAFYTQDYILNAEKKDMGIHKRKRVYRYNFIQTSAIRGSFDTLKRLESLKKVDFITGEERAQLKSCDTNITVVNNNLIKGKKGK